MDLGLALVVCWAWQETNIALSKGISRLARGLDIYALLDSSVALSMLKLRLVLDAHWAQMVSWAQLALQDLASFNLKLNRFHQINQNNNNLNEWI